LLHLFWLDASLVWSMNGYDKDIRQSHCKGIWCCASTGQLYRYAFKWKLYSPTLFRWQHCTVHFFFTAYTFLYTWNSYVHLYSMFSFFTKRQKKEHTIKQKQMSMSSPDTTDWNWRKYTWILNSIKYISFAFSFFCFAIFNQLFTYVNILWMFSNTWTVDSILTLTHGQLHSNTDQHWHFLWDREKIYKLLIFKNG